MAKKIILFLSDLRANAEPCTFLCPDGSSITGKQTNEVPVKYLLQKHPDISQILCILTAQAEKTAWNYFRQEISSVHSSVQYTPIFMEANQNFVQSSLTQILSCLSAGDTVFLETTGGFRNAIMDLTLLSQVLSFTGIHIAGAVYGNYSSKKLEDISDTIHLFNMIGSVQDLTSFGSVKRLQEYYSSHKMQQDSKIRSLLFAANKLSETITLCQTGKIEDTLNAFNTALSNMDGCSDPMMQALLPIIRDKFGRELTVPGLIKWCAENDLIQQAITIYREQIPVYLLTERPDLLELNKNLPSYKTSIYQSKYSAIFMAGLMEMGSRATHHSPWLRSHPYTGKYDNRIPMIENLNQLIPKSCFTLRCSAEQFSQIIMDFYYVHGLRNMVNHANDESPMSEQFLSFIQDTVHYPNPETASIKQIKDILKKCLDHLALSRRS